MNTPNNIVPISAADFIKESTSILMLPPFNEGGAEIPVQVRRVPVLAMMSNGALPNTLISGIMDLFGQKKDEIKEFTGSREELEKELGDQAKNILGADDMDIMQLGEAMSKFAEACLVSPTYAEIGDYLTDEQRTALFEFSMQGIKSVESFRSDSGDGTSDSNVRNLPPIA